MRHRENSDPFTDLAAMMKQTGYNKDVKLANGTILAMNPVKVRIDENGLETTNIKVLPHLLPAYYPAHIIFDDELGSRNATIMIDNGLEINDRVSLIYDDEGNKVKGYILAKEE